MALLLEHKLDIQRIIEMFPSLRLFSPITGHCLGLYVVDALSEGMPKDELQQMINSDGFIITLAGAVFSTLQQDDSFGCDAGVVAIVEIRHDSE